MIRRSLARRLDHLEARLRVDDEPLVIQIKYASPDGSVVDGPQITIPGAGGRQAGRDGLASGGRPSSPGWEVSRRPAPRIANDIWS
jgi:hypothetical protein